MFWVILPGIVKIIDNAENSVARKGKSGSVG